MASSEQFRHEITKKVIMLILAVGGLLVVRAIVDALPMIRNAQPIVLSTRVLKKDIGVLPIAGTLEKFRQVEKQPNVGLTLSLVHKDYRELYRQMQRHPHMLAGMGIILPSSIANAIIDTLIFISILSIVQGIRSLMMYSSARFPEGGTLVFFAAILAVVAWAYGAYEPIALPLMGRSSGIYGWIFLVLGLAPVAGIVMVSYRNIDAITGLVFSSAQTTLAQRCPRCRKPIESNADFCGECGFQLRTAVQPVSRQNQKCPHCAQENSPEAKFCRNCGKPLG